MLIYFSFELLFFPALCAPGCTFGLLPLPACYLGQFPRFDPAHFPQLMFGDARQIFVDSHQVIGFPSRVGKSLFEEIVRISFSQGANTAPRTLHGGNDRDPRTANPVRVPTLGPKPKFNRSQSECAKSRRHFGTRFLQLRLPRIADAHLLAVRGPRYIRKRMQQTTSVAFDNMHDRKTS